MATRAKCSGRLLCATAMSRPISLGLLILLVCHLIHNCYKYAAARPRSEVRRPQARGHHGAAPALDTQRNRSATAPAASTPARSVARLMMLTYHSSAASAVVRRPPAPVQAEEALQLTTI
jgi:hypothetical protein